MSGSGAYAPQPAAGSPLFDATRPGSVWQQALVGALGIALALVLVVGQVSVATTRGIQQHLHSNVTKLRHGNETMQHIIRQSAPTVMMQKVVSGQQQTLGEMHDTLVELNGEMQAIGATTRGLGATVRAMGASSGQLSTGVAGLAGDTSKITRLLQPVPATARHTGSSLGRINRDSRDINTELHAIGGKLIRYGLPQAKGVRGS